MFVTFEGVEGAGKTTVMGLLGTKLAAMGRDVLLTREPGGCQLGLELRQLLLMPCANAIDPAAELHLFLADRAQHLAEIIRPALASGKIVLCDRFSDSTIAYQGYGRGMALEPLRRLVLSDTAYLAPDLTFVLDLPVASGLERVADRGRRMPDPCAESRFDSESVAFHQRVRDGFLKLGAEEPQRIKIVDASRDVDAVLDDCLGTLQNLLSSPHKNGSLR